jgi:ribonuclease J
MTGAKFAITARSETYFADTFASDNASSRQLRIAEISIPSLLATTLEEASVEERTDPGLIKEKIRVDLQRFFRKRSGLRPLVLPVVMEI